MFVPGIPHFLDGVHVTDAHLLMTTAYDFWLHEGAWGCVKHRIVDSAKCLALVGAIIFLGFMINWEVAMSCATETLCTESTEAMFHAPSYHTVIGGHTAFATVLLTAAVAVTLWEVWQCAVTWSLQSELHHVLSTTFDCGALTPLHFLGDVYFRFRANADGHEHVPLGDELPNISDTSWSEYLHLLCATLRNDRHNLDETFDELAAVQTMMSFDNYFIALHQEILHPLELQSGLGGPAFRLVDQSTLKLLLKSLFDEYGELNVTINQVEAIRKKLRYYLIAYLVLYPFMVSYTIVKLLVKHVAVLKSNPSEYFEREWTNQSLWLFRLYNEVPHIADERLKEANKVANRMMGRVRRPGAFVKLLERLSSMVIFVGLLLYFLNPVLLTGAVIGGKALVWWMSAALIVFGASHRSETTLREYNHTNDLEQLVHLLHYDQPEWYVSGARWGASMGWDFLHSKLYLLLSALCRSILMPLILVKLYLDDSIPVLVQFFQRSSVKVGGRGSMPWGANFNCSPEIVDDFSVAVTECSSPNDELLNDKIQKRRKSIASFASVNPRWRTKVLSDDSDRLHINQELREMFEQSTPHRKGDPVQPTPLTGDSAINLLASSAMHGVVKSVTHEWQHLIVSRIDDSVRVARSQYDAERVKRRDGDSSSRRREVTSGGGYGSGRPVELPTLVKREDFSIDSPTSSV